MITKIREQSHVVYMSPTGTSFTDKKTLQRHLEAKKSSLKIETFSWDVSCDSSVTPTTEDDILTAPFIDIPVINEIPTITSPHSVTNATNVTNDTTDTSDMISPCILEKNQSISELSLEVPYKSLSNTPQKSPPIDDLHLITSPNLTDIIPETQPQDRNWPWRKSISFWDLEAHSKTEEERDELKVELKIKQEECLDLLHAMGKLEETNEKLKIDFQRRKRQPFR